MRFPMTEAEVTIHQARVHAGRGMAVSSREKLNHGAANAENTPSTVRPRRAKTPNKTETGYANLYLRPRLLVGEITRYDFEALTLVLPGGVRYTPDWYVVNKFGRVELHEIKGGFTWEDGMQKLKIAAAIFPFRFTLAQKVKGVWRVVPIGE